jgi:NAD(P)H-dependent flavin oxidoreductase YrpB (nitropropane dioxygenase family)
MSSRSSSQTWSPSSPDVSSDNEIVIRTAFTDLLGIKHPVALAGMGGSTSPELVAAVTNAGGLGIQGASDAPPDRLAELVRELRSRTKGPYGLNLLLAFMTEEEIDLVLDTKPSVFSTAWPNEDQDLKGIFARAHDRGAKVLHMVPTVADAEKAAEAGADVIVAQGTDGGGHIGLVGTVVIVPAVVKAVAPLPVLAAGGIADGRGLAAMLVLGAAGVLMGTRFLATPEAPVHPRHKDQIVRSDGTDTIVTDVGDIMMGSDWPGALARVARNRAVERWLGRTNELRRHREEVVSKMSLARKNGEIDEAVIYYGQSAALIDEIVPAAEVVARTVREAEDILRERLPQLIS